jgi:PAS domain S-box-containing protein
VEVSLRSLQIGGEDQLIAVVRDISQRRETDEELRQSEERYRTLFNNMMDGIYLSTHAGKFIEVNPALVSMFGYASKEEMLTLDIAQELYFTPEERGSHILNTNQAGVDIYRMRRKDGSTIDCKRRGERYAGSF